MAQINANTESDDAYASFLDAQDDLNSELMPDRQTYREQATAQVDWMLSGGVTLVLSLLVYVLAAFVLSVVASIVLHQIWGITTFR
jgi:elongation factor P hydroxylase